MNKNSQKKIQLIKLHGSLSWKKSEDKVLTKIYQQGELKSQFPLTECMILRPQLKQGEITDKLVDQFYNNQLDLYEESVKKGRVLYCLWWLFQ